jgi:hypothetical protein
MGRFVMRVQDAMPSRSPAPRRVTSMTARREMQRRGAVAILVFVAVAGSLGLAVSLFGNRPSPGTVIASAEVGVQALRDAQRDLDRVFGPGIDLVANDPKTAQSLLSDALAKLDVAKKAGIAAATIAPLRAKVVGGLDRLYGVVDVTAISQFTFPADPAVDLKGLVRGPDGAPYVLDAKTASVYRISLKDQKAVSIFRAGTKAKGSTEAAPVMITVGGPDLLILDAKNILWRWRPADATGRGTTTKVSVIGSAEWGNDLVAIGTFIRDPAAGLYNFYVVDPSAQEILAYAPAADGAGFPAAPSKRLTTPRPVDKVTSLYIDGDIWIADTGKILRVIGGTTEGWAQESLPDGALRSAPNITAIMSGSDRRAGRIYGYDPKNARLIAYLKADGSYVEQYRLAGGSKAWAAARGWYVEPGIADAPDTVVWITANGLYRAVLEPATSAPGVPATPGPSGSAKASPVVSAAP